MKIKTIDKATATYVTISKTKTVVGPNLALITFRSEDDFFMITAKFVKCSHSHVVDETFVLVTQQPESDQPGNSKFQNTHTGSVKFGVKC